MSGGVRIRRLSERDVNGSLATADGVPWAVSSLSVSGTRGIEQFDDQLVAEHAQLVEM